MKGMIEQFRNSALMPVVVLDNAKDAVPVADALRKGGIYCAEVTFRTAAAADSIRAMKQSFPDMLVGAGTVLSQEQVDAAVEAGAEFIVSPGLDPEVVDYCREKNIFIVPGISTASELEKAYTMGLQLVKFFPAEAAGGIDMIRSVAAPFSSMLFMPTGGISASNIQKYLKFPKVVACGGSWMVKKELISGGRFEEITRLSNEAMTSLLGFRLEHVGINAETEEEAAKTADAFCELFDFARLEKTESSFAGTAVEVMKGCGKGGKGHIAVGTYYVDRAKAYLEKKGICFDESSAKYKNGELTCIYLEKEIAGFAVHLVKIS